MDSFEVLSKSFAIIAGIVMASNAIVELRNGRKQREQELRWKQAATAREYLKDIHANVHAMAAAEMIDWGRGSHTYRTPDGRDLEISEADIVRALETPRAQATDPTGEYIWECFDWLFYFMDRLEHHTRSGFVHFADLEDVFRPYARKLSAHPGRYALLIQAQDYRNVGAFLARFESQGLGSGPGVALAIAGLLLGLAGCRAQSSLSPYAPQVEVERQTSVAERLNHEAADLMGTDPKRAEVLLRQALMNDLYFGPAHNNLGVLLFKRGDLYEAAHEFEWARKLLPGNPDPRINLALTLERAGRLEDAFAAYESALEVAPEYLPAIQGAASIALRTRKDDKRLTQWLARIALCDDPTWATWARKHGTMLSPP